MGPSARSTEPASPEPASPEPASPEDDPPERSLRRVKIATVAFVALGLFAAQQAGLLEIFAEPARVKQALVDLGPLGHVAFVVAYALLQPFGVPGTVFILAAPLIWPWPVAFALSMAGTMSASVVGFSFARFVARDWIATRIPARFRAYDEALARRGFATVFVLRLVFWMPPMLHAFFGVSSVSFWTHFWGSLCGYVLPLLATAYFGEKLVLAMRDAPASTWIAVGSAVLTVVSVLLLVRRRARRKKLLLS